jgi:hypothetical protein
VEAGTASPALPPARQSSRSGGRKCECPVDKRETGRMRRPLDRIEGRPREQQKCVGRRVDEVAKCALQSLSHLQGRLSVSERQTGCSIVQQ